MREMIKYFKRSREAWAFLKVCDALGIKAGYPSLTDNGGKGYSVRYIPL